MFIIFIKWDLSDQGLSFCFLYVVFGVEFYMGNKYNKYLLCVKKGRVKERGFFVFLGVIVLREQFEQLCIFRWWVFGQYFENFDFYFKNGIFFLEEIASFSSCGWSCDRVVEIYRGFRRWGGSGLSLQKGKELVRGVGWEQYGYRLYVGLCGSSKGSVGLFERRRDVVV